MRTLAIVSSALLAIPAVVRASDAAAGQFFEARIRPLLSTYCFECHSDKKQKGALRLDSREAILKGGESGPAMVPGDPGSSLLVNAVRYRDADLQMPPKKKLGRRAVQDLELWIAQGAVWPGREATAATAADGAEHTFAISDEDRAYWAFQPVAPPPAANLDQIIDESLAANGLAPNPPADPATLIRRAYFDLIGLPPRYDDVQAFLGDPDPEAFAKLLDRLLAMPEYGERWGRHWLDVVRYAQSNGYERDDEKPDSWRYRDYVIDAFNQDKAYDRFVLEQIAGDELPDAGDPGLIATGFFRLGVHDDEPDDKRAAEFDALDDMLKTTTETFLGLTAGCARCHDHMFDPVSQRDYYELLAFFRNVQPYPAGARDIAGGKAMAVSEHGPEPMATHLLVRGNAGRPSVKVAPRFPEILGGGAPEVHPAPDGKSTGLRRALAQWIARPEHPLTARVMANRVWQYHFGRGIVPTPNDFGKAGEPPANLALLDWLAAEFVHGGWSVKHLHRVIMQSRAYQRSSMAHAANDTVDPGNIHVWRQNMRRLEAEAIRDAMLAAAGALNQRRGGDRGFFPAVAGEVVAGASRPGRGWGWSPEPEQNRRSVYAFIKRTMVYPFFEIFDYTNTEGSLGARPVTTVAPQALLMLNSEFVATSSERLAQRVCQQDDPVGSAFRLALARDPSSQERALAAAYLDRQARHHAATGHLLRLAPDYSAALFTDFHAALPAERYLRGPSSAGWNYFKGGWGDTYEGIINNDPQRPPFALFGSQAGDIECLGEITLAPTVTRASILLRASAGGDRLEGVECLIDAENCLIAIRRHQGEVITTLAQHALSIDDGQPLAFVAAANGNELTFRVGAVELLASDPAAQGAAGRPGLSVSGGPMTLSDARLRSGGHLLPLVPPDPQRPALRALQDFCALLFNLNEFVYVD